MALPYATPGQLELLEKKLKSTSADPKDIKELQSQVQEANHMINQHGVDISEILDTVNTLNTSVKENQNKIVEVEGKIPVEDTAVTKLVNFYIYAEATDTSVTDVVRVVLPLPISLKTSEWKTAEKMTDGKLLYKGLKNNVESYLIPCTARRTTTDGNTDYDYMYLRFVGAQGYSDTTAPLNLIRKEQVLDLTANSRLEPNTHQTFIGLKEDGTVENSSRVTNEYTVKISRTITYSIPK